MLKWLLLYSCFKGFYGGVLRMFLFELRIDFIFDIGVLGVLRVMGLLPLTNFVFCASRMMEDECLSE